MNREYKDIDSKALEQSNLDLEQSNLDSKGLSSKNLNKIEYLSPSGYKLYRTDREEYYKQYLSGVKRIYGPGNKHMAIGSAFGARVQSALAADLLGRDKDTVFLKLFNDSVDMALRAEVLEPSEQLFERYKRSGAYADLLDEVNLGEVSSFNYEFRMMGGVEYNKESIILYGKPDIFFTVSGMALVPDFKVNGYWSEKTTSPIRYAKKIRRVDGSFSAHKDFSFSKFNGIVVHNGCLSSVDLDWAIQLTMYAWLCGVPVGGTFILGIENIVGPASAPRFATARFKSPSQEWQEKLFSDVSLAWKVINSDHYFREVSQEDSLRRCELLSRQVTQPDWLGSMMEQDKPKW